MATRRKSALDTIAPTDNQRLDQSMIKAERVAKEQFGKVVKQQLKPVTLAPSYKDYFGEVMTVQINGMSVYVPVNGRTYHIPKDFAALVQERRRKVDDMLNRQAILGDVTRNKEHFAGQLELIPR
jgi:hypothetical protein